MLSLNIIQTCLIAAIFFAVIDLPSRDKNENSTKENKPSSNAETKHVSLTRRQSEK